MHPLQLIKKHKVYLLFLIMVILEIPPLVYQAGGESLGWRSFQPIFFLVLVIGWGLLFFCRKASLGFAGKTACITLICGLLLIMVQPVLNGYDESEHLFKVIASLDGKGLRYSDYNYEMSNSFFTLREMRGSAWWELGNAPWSAETTMTEVLIDGRAQPTYPVWGYLFSMAGVGITRLFHAPLSLIYLMGKVMNLVGFVFLGTWALKTTPKLKAVFAVFMCMPASLFVVCSYHSDATTYGLVMLVMAYFLKWKDESSVPLREWILWSILLFLLVPLKFPYIGLLGLLFLLPKDSFHFKHANIWKCVLILVISAFSLLWATQISSNFVEWVSVGFDREAQMEFILSHPLETLWIFLSSIFSQLPDFIDRFFALSGCNGAILPGPFKETHVLLICAALFFSEKLNWKKGQRLWLFLMILGIWLLTNLALYVTFTPVGSLVMLGVQGRYLTPLLLAAALIFPKAEQHPWKEERLSSAVCYCNIIFPLMLTLGIGYYFYL